MAEFIEKYKTLNKLMYNQFNPNHDFTKDELYITLLKELQDKYLNINDND